MANPAHLAKLQEGFETWNKWRQNNPKVKPDLSEANLSEARLRKANLSYADLSYAKLRDADLSYAKLRDADLSSADLSSANLSLANLSSADLSYTNLSEAKLRSTKFRSANLRYANPINADLSYADLRYANLSLAQLRSANLRDANLSSANLSLANLSSANLSLANLSSANLRDANLSSANLSSANLHASQVLNANFTGSNFTGTCIADWQIGKSTQLDGVQCDYIFRTYDAKSEQFLGRLPVDLKSTFASGEFTRRFQILADALETIDITFTDGVDWQAFFQSFQELRQQYPAQNIDVQGMEEKGGAFIVRLKVEAKATGVELEQLKGAIETTQKQLYSTQLALSAAQGKIEVYREMMGVVKTLAGRPMGDLNFHGPVGNVAQTNQGKMQAVQHNYAAPEKQSLADAALEIQRLLKQLEATNPTATEAEQKAFVTAAIPPTLRQRAVGALQSGGKAALEELLDNPYVNVAIAVIEGWQAAE